MTQKEKTGLEALEDLNSYDRFSQPLKDPHKQELMETIFALFHDNSGPTLRQTLDQKQEEQTYNFLDWNTNNSGTFRILKDDEKLETPSAKKTITKREKILELLEAFYGKNLNIDDHLLDKIKQIDIGSAHSGNYLDIVFKSLAGDTVVRDSVYNVRISGKMSKEAMKILLMQSKTKNWSGIVLRGPSYKTTPLMKFLEANNVKTHIVKAHPRIQPN